jgi:hypothetical protein
MEMAALREVAMTRLVQMLREGKQVGLRPRYPLRWGRLGCADG